MNLVRCTTETLLGSQKEAKKRRKSKECYVDNEEVKSIFFRGKNNDKEDLFFIIPYTCLSPKFTLNNNNTNNKNKKLQQKRELDCMFNHTLLHTNPIHYLLPQVPAPPHNPPGLFEARWAVLGSTVYFFGSKGKTRNKIYYLKKYVDRYTSMSYLSFKKAGYMIKPRDGHSVVALDNKVYVIGGDDDLWAEVFEPLQDCPQGQSKALSSPPSSSRRQSLDFAVAIEKEKKIVAGGGNGNIFEYDVAGDSWVYHKPDFEFKFRSCLCRPVAAGSCLYWLDNNLLAYDLNTKLSYEGPIEDCLIQHVLDNPDSNRHPSDFQITLLHISGDLFYMIWVDRCLTEILHCTTIQALKTTTKLQGNHYKLQTTVLSCQTFVSKDPLDLQGSPLML